MRPTSRRLDKPAVKHRAGPVGFPTRQTFVGLLPGVGPLVNDELGAGKEEFPTDQALVGFACCAAVLQHPGILLEALNVHFVFSTSFGSNLDLGDDEGLTASPSPPA